MIKKFRYFIFSLIVLTTAVLLFLIFPKRERNIIEIEFNAATDIDGNIYTAVTIGKQVWLKENLKTTRFNDGTSIINIKKDMIWAEMESSAYCWYNNNSLSNKNRYGALYNWYAVNYGKLCPTGWHVPTDNEWTTLTEFLGGDSIAGGKIKEAGASHWKSKTRATNESGFKAVPAGYRYIDGIFYDKGRNETWWSSTEASSTAAFSRLVSYGSSNIYRINYYQKNHGFSVRCVRDTVD
jgi:uncharacterized protein (TIGR02145 family)